MKFGHRVALALSVALVSSFLASAAVAPVAVAGKPTWTKNCTNLNKRFPHGVGKRNARDKTSSSKKVTNFKRSNRLYKTAMRHNKGLDRDKDGIACEKA